MKLIIPMLVCLLLVSNVMALEESFGTFEKNECVDLVQACSSCSYVYVISITAPNSSQVLSTDTLMTKSNYDYNYTFCATSLLGEYIVKGYGDVNGVDTIWTASFDITISGQEDINSGEGLSLLGSLFIIILVGVFFFIMSFRINNSIGKFSFIVISCIILLMGILYTMVIVQQTLGGFENLVSGYSTFYFVLKIIAGISITALMILALLVSIRFYKFKRGFLD